MATGNHENSYKSILKRISTFGGLQVFQIFVNLLRGRFVAMLLGPEGMGISSLFLTSSITLQQLGGLGTNLSVVKEVAAASNDSDRRGTVMKSACMLIAATSLFGALICMLLSPILSQLTFGSADYTFWFIILGTVVGLGIGATGFQAILQGIGEIKRLSKAAIVGSLTGLFTGVPLYYFFGVAGIVPAMIILGASQFLFYFISYRKSVSLDGATFSWKIFTEQAPLIRRLISLGVIFMIGSLVGSATNYAINALVRYMGSLEDVGLFQAANSLTNQYIGIIFSALTLDYFPRLSAAGNSSDELKEIVNRQAEIVILVATPLLLALICIAPFAILILLSEKFLVIIPLLRWLAYGTLLQAVTFPLGYIFLAKDNKKAYVWSEVIIGNVLWITFSIGGYWIFGLIGLGLSLVIRTALDVVISYLLCRYFYSFKYYPKVAVIIAGCVCIAAIGLAASFMDSFWGDVIMWSVTILTVIFAVIRLRRLIQSEKDNR